MRGGPASWREIHDAKNDLAAAMLLLERARNGATVDLAQVEVLIRSAVERMNDYELDCGGGWESLPRGAAGWQIARGRSRRPSSGSRRD